MHKQWSILVHSGVCVCKRIEYWISIVCFFPDFYKPHCVCLQMSLSTFRVANTTQSLFTCRPHQHLAQDLIKLPGPFTRKLQDTSEYYRHILAISGICRHTIPCAESKHLLRSVGTLAPHMLCSSHPHQPKTLRENTGKKTSVMLHNDESKSLKIKSNNYLFGLIVYQHHWACLLAAQRILLDTTSITQPHTNCVVFTPT